jgi:hypothetical protein
MRVIGDSDIREFVDENGDKFITLAKIRKKDYDARNQLILEMSNIDITNPAKPTISDIKIDPIKINIFMFKAVAKKMIINGQEIEGEALLETYSNLDQKSGEWIDKCVAEVWGEEETVKKN